MRFGSILFRLLGLMVFGGARKYFSEQPPEMRDELCRRARMLALSPLFYYVLAEELPEKWRAVFKLDFYTASQRELKFSEAWKHVCGIFQSCGAPFVPLKGSSLAREVYPHPALRFRRDLDVLFHRADIERVFRKFRGDGWETHGRNHPFFTRLHLPTLVKPSFPALELHWHVLKNRTLFDPEHGHGLDRPGTGYETPAVRIVAVDVRVDKQFRKSFQLLRTVVSQDVARDEHERGADHERVRIDCERFSGVSGICEHRLPRGA